MTSKMSLNTSTNATLLQLPVELIIKVSRYLDFTSNDLVNLRNTCSALHNIIKGDHAFYSNICRKALRNTKLGEPFPREIACLKRHGSVGDNLDWQLLLAPNNDRATACFDCYFRAYTLFAWYIDYYMTWRK